MTDHDQRFKTVLREFFREFLQLFFPALADRFDLTQVEWLDQELFLDPPQGRKSILDLVAKVATRQALPGHRADEAESWLCLILVEIESADRVAPLRPRIFDYYTQLRHRHALPVLPIGVYLRVGLEGIGWDVYEEHLWEHQILQLHYAYVGLPALDAERYLAGDSLLGVALAVLMRLPKDRRAEIRLEALRRVATSGENTYRQFLLAECIQAYLSLTDEEKRRFNALLASPGYEEVRVVATTFYEEGVEQGIQQGQRQLVRILLEDRFGTLSPLAQERLARWPAEQIVELMRAANRGASLKEMGLED